MNSNLGENIARLNTEALLELQDMLLRNEKAAISAVVGKELNRRGAKMVRGSLFPKASINTDLVRYLEDR